MSEIKEIPNKEFKVIAPKFICDDPNNKIPEPFPKSHFNLLVVGRPGSGKSSLAVNLIAGKKRGSKVYRKMFYNIYIICPEGSMKSLKKNPFKELDSDCIYHEFSYENLLDIYNKISDNAEEEENSLLYLDDLAAELKNGGRALENIFKKLAYNRRHLRLSIINCIQRLTALPKAIRAGVSDLIFFNLSKNENKILYDEMLDIPLNRYITLCNHSFKTKHDNIYVKLDSLEFYRNFNKLEGVCDHIII